MRKLIVSIALIFCVFFVAACNEETSTSSSTTTTTTNSTSTITTTTAVQTTTTAVQATTTTQPTTTTESGNQSSYSSTAKLETSFELEIDETCLIDGNCYLTYVEYAIFDEDTDDERRRFDYEFIKNNVSYTGNFFAYINGEVEHNPEEYNPNEIVFVSYDDNVMTLKVMPETIVPDALVLSEDKTAYYTTTKLEYIETDDYILFLDKNIQIKNDICDNIDTIMTAIETKSGLDFDGISKYTNEKMVSIRDSHYGKNAFRGVDPEYEKFSIYVVYDFVDAYASASAIVIGEMDIHPETGETIAMIHELCHAVQLRNGAQTHTQLLEGYATAMTEKVMRYTDALFPHRANNYVNYTFSPSEPGYDKIVITEANAEDLFRSTELQDHDYYCYGFRFCLFLSEHYSEFIFNEIMEVVNETQIYTFIPVDIDDTVNAIKEKTEADVFIEFAKWLNTPENIARFH